MEKVQLKRVICGITLFLALIGYGISHINENVILLSFSAFFIIITSLFFIKEFLDKNH